jgi:F-type H+-transporting ATPase subunit a
MPEEGTQPVPTLYEVPAAETAATHTEAPHEGGIHVELAAEKLGQIGGYTITNTLLTSWIVMAILIVTAIAVGRRAKLVPSRIQILFEEVITFVRDFMTDVLEDKAVASRYLPLLLTIFFFIFTANVLEFTPGIGSITFWNGEAHVPLLRSMNTDLNVTLALAIICFVMIEIAGFVALGLRSYAGKFFNFSGHSIGERFLNLTVGLIELISELGRLISFSFRLFGNIFAGEVLLAVATYFAPYIVPVPLMSFELFVGFIQAAVFALLTLFFIKLAITDAHAEGAH